MNRMIKTFGKEKIEIKELSTSDIKKASQFRDFINSLITEDAMIATTDKKSTAQEKQWLLDNLKRIRDYKSVMIVAEHENAIVGSGEINLESGRGGHVGTLHISVRKNYRGKGLGGYIMKKLLSLSQKKLGPSPKIIKLSVFSSNKQAQNLYKKFGFRKVAEIPKQIQYKGKFINEVVMILELQ